jgi:hypothetical protein
MLLSKKIEGVARQEQLESNLREAAKAYIHVGLLSYIKLEGDVSLWQREKFGDSANVVSSLHRGIEHLLKLRLAKLDPLLLYPFPKRIEDYCRVRGLAIRGDTNVEKSREENEAHSHTVSFREALTRVITTTDSSCDSQCFIKLNALRNSLEHHWDRNEALLENVIGEVSKTVLPGIRNFIETVLQEPSGPYFDKKLIAEVERLDRALANSRSLQAQRKLETHTDLFAKNPDECRRLPKPKILPSLKERELPDVECPVCKTPMSAYWDWEPDYDVEGSSGPAYLVGVYPDVKYLFCDNCHFSIEDRDVGPYITDEIVEDIMEEEKEDERVRYGF